MWLVSPPSNEELLSQSYFTRLNSTETRGGESEKFNMTLSSCETLRVIFIWPGTIWQEVWLYSELDVNVNRKLADILFKNRNFHFFNLFFYITFFTCYRTLSISQFILATFES